MILRSRSASPMRAVIAVMAAALIPAIAGCEAGANAPTQQWHQPTPGASAVIGKVIRLNNMFVLGAGPDSSLQPGMSAGVFLALYNGGGTADRLLRISAPGSAQSVVLPGGGVTLRARQSVLLTGPQPRVVLQGLTRSLIGGQSVRMVLDFQRAGLVTLDVPVMPRASYYATFSPAPAPATATPTPSPSTSGNKKKHSKAASTASPTPSATSATPTPTATG